MVSNESYVFLKQYGLNTINSTCIGPSNCIARLNSLVKYNESVLRPKPDVSFLMTISYHHPTVPELYQSNTYEEFSRKKTL
ncbi:hypothetical protein C0J52_08065 [Blattella germanica]|nr:hypothetical protein C0J52_08065 [Blattella germanica]